MNVKWLCAIKTTIFVIFDLLLTVLCISWHGVNFSFREHFLGQISTNFSYFHSTIDFIILALWRMLIISFGCALVIAGSGVNVFVQLRYISLSACILFCCFSPVKLLALSDHTEKRESPTIYAGDWLLFTHNLIASLMAHFLFGRLVAVASRKCSLRAQNGSLPSSSSQVSNYEVLRNSFQDMSSEDDEPRDDNLSSESRTAVIIIRLLQYCKDEWIWHLSGFTWLFIYSLTRIFVPYYTGQVIASVISTEGDKYVALINAVKFMIFISVVSAVAGGLRGGSFEYAYARINRAVRRDLFGSLVKQDVSFFDAHKTGEITSRLTSDTQTMSDTVSLNINVFLRNMVQMGGSMIFMMTLCWKLSLIPFIIVPIFLMASKIFGVYYDILSEKAQSTVAHSNDVAEEVLSTMRTVRSFACEDSEKERFYQKLTNTLSVTRHKAFAYVGFMWVSELFQTVINVAVLWYGGHLVLTKQLEKDLLVSFLLYQMQLADNIRQLGEVWTGLMQSVGASRKVFEYVDRRPRIDMSGQYEPSTVQGRIEFQNVHFSYPSRPNNAILKGLSFSMEPGEVVALVGPSGGGKSSCIALLEHFYEPAAGRVLIDGVPVTHFEHHYIHRKVALVGQEPVLFARSVAENISYGLDESTNADVIEAAKMANAHAFILNTRDQYETNVGEKGSQMSGGQKQRIAIARALIRQPAILLLDEATSALDTESEHLVQEAIYKNLKGRSVILIAHRLSTVEKADKIILINQGRVEQMGTHEQLLSQEGMYRQLVQRQMIASSSPEVAIAVTSVLQNIGEMSPTAQHKSAHRDDLAIMSTSPRNIAHSLLATSFSQSLSSLQSK